MHNSSNKQLTPSQYAQNTILLFDAVKAGCVKDVEDLIPVSTPKLDESFCLFMAADGGHIDIIKLLLPVSDPKARESAAMRIAALNGNVEVLKYLLPFSDSEAALNKMSGDIRWAKALVLLQQCIDEYEALQQQERLNNTLAETVDAKKKWVKRKM